MIYEAPLYPIVSWYPNGDPKDPVLALVTGPWPFPENGILKLASLPKGFSQMVAITGAHHRDDPILEKNPKVMKRTGGFWDYWPGTEPKNGAAREQASLAEKIEQEKADSLTALEAAKKVLYELADEHPEWGQTTLAYQLKKKTGLDWAHQKVGALLRSRK